MNDSDWLEAQLSRMLDDPRTIARSQQFFAEWLNLGRLQNLRPSPKHFPDWTADIAEDMKAETLAFVTEVIWEQKRPLSDLLNAQFTRVTPRLAKHYGLDLPEQANQEQLTRIDLSSLPGRGGLLTHGSVLTVGGDEASMVTRGLFVMHELLRGVVRDPPPCVDTTPVPSQPGVTQRTVAETRIANESCSGCHSKFEPLAFGLEKYDGLGGYADTDEFGNELREDGEVLFPGQAIAVAFSTSAELMDLLAHSERVRESFTWKLTQFAIGRPLGAADAKTVAQIHERGQANGGTYSSLIRAIITSDLVMRKSID